MTAKQSSVSFIWAVPRRISSCAGLRPTPQDTPWSSIVRSSFTGWKSCARIPGLRWEARRLHTLEEGLESVRKDLRARRTPIEVSPGSFDRQFASLPEGIRLEPGQLTVSFNTAAGFADQTV